MILLSEVIESFIRANPGLSEAEAFDGFLRQDRIRAWVGQDSTRRERLSKEFSKVWTEMASAAPASAPPAAATPASTSARAGPGMRQTQSMSAPVAQVAPRSFGPTEVPVTRPRRAAGNAARKLDLLCPACGHIDVWNDDGVITCRSCERTYTDMLLLIPVQPVGAFEYVFGGGTTGWLVAGGIVVLLAGVYLVVKLAG